MGFVGRADDGHGRLQKVRHCRSFAHELRIDADAEVRADAFTAGFFQRWHHDGFRCARQHRAAQHHQMKRILFLQDFADFSANRFDVSEIEFSIAQAGRADTKEGNVAVQNRRFRRTGGMQPAGLMRLGDNFAHPRFHDGAISRIHGLDLGPAQIDANDIVAPVGQTGGGYRANVSQAEYANGAIHAFGSNLLKIDSRNADRTSRASNALFKECAMISINSLFSATSQANKV